MSTALLTRRSRVGSRARRIALAPTKPTVTFRLATANEAPALHTLIEAHVAEGHLLPRQLVELTAHAPRFVVAIRDGAIVGCAELAPLSERVAEVRSLVVDRRARALGIGRALVTELQERARREGFAELCAFTHDAGYFVRLGFSIVPHAWVPEKIAHDCQTCPLFRRCGQYAVVLPLAKGRERESVVPPAKLRG